MGVMDRKEIGIKDDKEVMIKEGDYILFEDCITTSNENGTEYDTFKNVGLVKYDYDEAMFTIFALDSEETFSQEEAWGGELEVLGNLDTHRAEHIESEYSEGYNIVPKQ